MSNSEYKSIAYILFWWNVGYIKELDEELLNQIQETYKLYFNFKTEREALALADHVQAMLDGILHTVNEILQKYEIQVDNVSVFGFLYFFGEYMLETTKNPVRRQAWENLINIVTEHPLHKDVNETQDYDYLDRIESCFNEIMRVLEKTKRR